jgi:hypothetical protein
MKFYSGPKTTDMHMTDGKSIVFYPFHGKWTYAPLTPARVGYVILTGWKEFEPLNTRKYLHTAIKTLFGEEVSYE